jgi:hypothetical protein
MGTTLQKNWCANSFRTFSFDAGVSFSLGGNLNLTTAPGVAFSGLVGETFRLFDWTVTAQRAIQYRKRSGQDTGKWVRHRV